MTSDSSIGPTNPNDPTDPTAADPALDSPGHRPGRRGVVLGFLGVAATAACTTAAPNAGSSPGTGTGSGTRSGTASGPGGAGQALPGAASTTASITPPAPPGQQPPASAPVTPGLADPGPDIVNGARTGTFVALTFHGAGDLALTARALNVARDTDAMFTVFAVGQWLAATPPWDETSLGPGTTWATTPGALSR